MIPTLLSRVPRGPRDPSCCIHCEPANYSLGVLTERMAVNPAGVWETVSSPHLHGVRTMHEETHI